MKTNYAEQFKIRISNPDVSMSKHEIVKLLITMAIRRRYKKFINHQLVYTEYPLNGKTPDVYHYNNRTNEVLAYEVQKEITNKWKEETEDAYEKIGVKDWQLVDLNKLSKEIPDLDEVIDALIKQVEKLVV